MKIMYILPILLLLMVSCDRVKLEDNQTVVNLSKIENLENSFKLCYKEGMHFKEEYNKYKQLYEREKETCTQEKILESCNTAIKQASLNTSVCLPYIKTIKRLENEKVSLILSNDTNRCMLIEDDLNNCEKALDKAEVKLNETLNILI